VLIVEQEPVLDYPILRNPLPFLPRSDIFFAMAPLSRKPVLIITDRTLSFGRGVLLGISRYTREVARDWQPVTWDTPNRCPPWDRQFAGAVGYITYEPVVKWVLEHTPLAVSTSGQRRHLPIPRVLNDDVAIGRAGARHLLGAGHRHFLFAGCPGRQHSRDRHAGLLRELRSAEVKELHGCGNEPEAIRRALQSAELPLAVMADNDQIALQVLAACDDLELRVPEQVAILGVDDDELLCETARVTISSVRIDARRVGYEAAALLHRMMQGHKPPDAPVLVGPLSVTARRSTQHYAVGDPVVAHALEWIDQHCDQQINVPEVAEAVGLSRSALERHFTQAIDLTPYQAILQAHIDRAANLLANTDWSMERVARSAGFSSGKMLSTTFAKHMDCCPSEYRARHRTYETSVRL
jgi:LacI family transcriptional regulator